MKEIPPLIKEKIDKLTEELKKVYELDFWMNGFRAGYNRATPDEISDKEIEKAAKQCRFEDLDISVGSFELGAKWYREQLKQTK